MKKILVIGHRGARVYAPENTIPSYQIALTQGVDWIDVDIAVTKDKILLAFHDLFLNPDILRLSNIKQKTILVKDLTLEQLRQFNVVLEKNSDYGKQFPQQEQFKDLKLSTLQEVVDYVNKVSDNSINFQIEIKTDFENPNWSYSEKELAELVYEFIIKNNLINRIKVQSFDWRVLTELNNLNSSIKTAYLYSENLRKNWKKWFSSTIITEIASQYENISILQLIKKLGGYSYEPEDNCLTIEELQEAHNLGLKVMVWGYPKHSGFVFNSDLMRKLINWGVDGIITDDPLKLNNILKELSYSTPKKINCHSLLQ